MVVETVGDNPQTPSTISWCFDQRRPSGVLETRHKRSRISDLHMALRVPITLLLVRLELIRLTLSGMFTHAFVAALVVPLLIYLGPHRTGYGSGVWVCGRTDRRITGTEDVTPENLADADEVLRSELTVTAGFDGLARQGYSSSART